MILVGAEPGASNKPSVGIVDASGENPVEDGESFEIESPAAEETLEELVIVPVLAGEIIGRTPGLQNAYFHDFENPKQSIISIATPPASASASPAISVQP
jgi:hypothetical protein